MAKTQASTKSDMQALRLLTFCLVSICSVSTAQSNESILSSQQILPELFRPPQVFKNAHLLRNINLEKGYARESINVVIENIDSSPQDEYFVPFKAEIVSKIGGLEVRDKKDPGKPAFNAEIVEYDPYRFAIANSESFTAILTSNAVLLSSIGSLFPLLWLHLPSRLSQ